MNGILLNQVVKSNINMYKDENGIDTTTQLNIGDIREGLQLKANGTIVFNEDKNRENYVYLCVTNPNRTIRIKSQTADNSSNEDLVKGNGVTIEDNSDAIATTYWVNKKISGNQFIGSVPEIEGSRTENYFTIGANNKITDSKELLLIGKSNNANTSSNTLLIGNYNNSNGSANLLMVGHHLKGNSSITDQIGTAEIIFGKYNEPVRLRHFDFDADNDEDYPIFEIGNGTENKRNSSLNIYSNGCIQSLSGGVFKQGLIIGDNNNVLPKYTYSGNDYKPFLLIGNSSDSQGEDVAIIVGNPTSSENVFEVDYFGRISGSQLSLQGKKKFYIPSIDNSRENVSLNQDFPSSSISFNNPNNNFNTSNYIATTKYIYEYCRTLAERVNELENQVASLKTSVDEIGESIGDIANDY